MLGSKFYRSSFARGLKASEIVLFPLTNTEEVTFTYIRMHALSPSPHLSLPSPPLSLMQRWRRSEQHPRNRKKSESVRNRERAVSWDGLRGARAAPRLARLAAERYWPLSPPVTEVTGGIASWLGFPTCLNFYHNCLFDLFSLSRFGQRLVRLFLLSFPPDSTWWLIERKECVRYCIIGPFPIDMLMLL